MTQRPATIGAAVAALRDPQPSWVTLPPADVGVPSELRNALDAFDAGARPAAIAAAEWLKAHAESAYTASRTRLLVSDGRVAGFYSLASAHVELSQRDRKRLGIGPISVPATLVTWIAKNVQVGIDGKVLLLHAAATARRVALLQATCVIVVDPFDEETAAMWRERFGFRASSGPAERKRLWLALHAVG